MQQASRKIAGLARARQARRRRAGEAAPVHNERRSLLVLVSGLSRAGKSMFARQLCEAIASAQHLPFARAVERIRRTLAM